MIAMSTRRFFFIVAIGLHLSATLTTAKESSSSSSSAKKTEVWSLGIPNLGTIAPGLKVAASHPHEYYGYPNGGSTYANTGYGGNPGAYVGYGGGHGEFEFGSVTPPSYKGSFACGHRSLDIVPWFLMLLGALMLIPLFGALIQFKLQALAPLFGLQGQTPLVTTQVGGTRTNLQARLLSEILPMVDKAIEHYSELSPDSLKSETANLVKIMGEEKPKMF